MDELRPLNVRLRLSDPALADDLARFFRKRESSAQRCRPRRPAFMAFSPISGACRSSAKRRHRARIETGAGCFYNPR